MLTFTIKVTDHQRQLLLKAINMLEDNYRDGGNIACDADAFQLDALGCALERDSLDQDINDLTTLKE